jgi:hypothetical protein
MLIQENISGAYSLLKLYVAIDEDLQECFWYGPHYASCGACAAHSLTVLLTGLFPLQVLDCVSSFTGNRVRSELLTGTWGIHQLCQSIEALRGRGRLVAYTSPLSEKDEQDRKTGKGPRIALSSSMWLTRGTRAI